MIDLKLGKSTHDLVVQDYDLQLVAGVDQVAQNIKQRIWLFRGEWFLDTTVGVPWLQDILKKNPRRFVVEQALKQAILGTAGVDELVEFSLEDGQAERSVRVTFKVRADGRLLEDNAEVSI